MRVTNSIMANGSLSRLQANLRSMHDIQSRISSGLRIERSSDDPAGASAVMQASGSLRALEQYRRNIDGATSRLSAEEGAIEQLGSLLDRAKELATSQSGSTATAQTRSITAKEIRQLRDAAVALGNTQFAGSYLFGGDYATTPPFDAAQPAPFRALDPVTALPRDPVGRRQIEIGSGQFLDGTRHGKQVFLDTGAFAAIESLLVGLEANDEGGIRTAATAIDAAIDAVQAQLGDVGARANRLEMAASNIAVLENNLTTYKSELSEIDVEAAFTELVSRQTAYQAAMLATSRISGMSLTEYLR
jgi:flagellar hook-associated protein 3 FlgL